MKGFGFRSLCIYVSVHADTIRSVPANPADSLLCMLLAQNAVHGAMAGYTKMTTGLCNNRVVYLPMTAVVASSPRTMTADGR